MSVEAATTHTTLLARLRGGEDAEAWREFHARYGGLIRGFARGHGLQPPDCDDIAQDVLLSLSKAMPSFHYDASKGKFRSYLKTVTLRAIFKRNRQNHGQTVLEPLEESARTAETDGAMEQAWETEWRQYHLRQAMRVVEAEFTTADLRAFDRCAVEGGDARETAAALGMSVAQVYQAKSRITKRLAQLIELQVQDEG